MPNYDYAQYDWNGYIHTVQEAKAKPATVNVVEIPSRDDKYIGCLYDGNFRKLSLTASKPTLAIGEVATITVQWTDENGNPVTVGEDVTLTCNGITETVTVANGQGSTTFSSQEAGEFTLMATSPAGVRASLKVVVS